jgi:hypothetical protein
MFIIKDNFIHDNSCDGYDVNGVGCILWYSEGSFQANEVMNNNGTADRYALGGGFYQSGVTGATTISGNYFMGNSLSGSQVQGGGMQMALGDEQADIEDNIFEQNVLSASNNASGGGMICLYSSNVSIVGNQFLENVLHGAMVSGGGLYVDESSSLTDISSNTFIANVHSGSGSGFGGGLSLFGMHDIPLEIDQNYFEDNSMSKGGAIFSFNCFNTRITNNVISNNNASSEGGGIRFRYFPGKLNSFVLAVSRYDRSDHDPKNHDIRSVTHPIVMNNTFVGNTSGQGGAIYCDHEAEVPLIVNSIFYDNEADMGDNVFNLSADSLLIAFCNVNDSANTFIYGKWKGNDNFFAEPGFIDTLCHIDENSPCIDSGADSVEFDGNWYFSPNLDFDGTIRPYGEGLIDIGADENDIFQEIFNPVFNTQHSTLNIQIFPNPTQGISDFRFLIADFGRVEIKIYDMHGREVAMVLDEALPAGEHEVRFDASMLLPGVYVVVLRAEGEERRAVSKLVVR